MGLEDLIGDLFDDGREKVSSDIFEDMIVFMGLTPKYNVILEGQDIIINEEWFSNESIKANRIYMFDVNFIDIIKEDHKNSVLKEILDIYVKLEDYTNASIIRDLINN